jgi:hypothetical protein
MRDSLPKRFLAATRRNRRRTRTTVTVATVSCFAIGGATMLLLPMLARPRAAANAAAGSASRAHAPRAVPRVMITAGVVKLDGHEVARTDAIEESHRMQRIDGLFDAIRSRRFDDVSDGTPSETVEIEVAPDVEAVVVKSILQTVAFAGYSDVRFVLADGGSVRAP